MWILGRFLEVPLRFFLMLRGFFAALFKIPIG